MSARRRVLVRATSVAVALAVGLAGAPRGYARVAAGPRAVPVLDKAKAARAVAAYQKAINDLCDSLWLSPEGKPMRPQWDPNNYDVQRAAAPHTGDEQAVARLQAIGLDRAEEIPLCEKRDSDARPLASGSFLVAGADEVLLEAWNGAVTLAPRALALMRGDRKGYHLVTHLNVGNSPAGNHFEARLRLTTGTRVDILFLCEAGGIQGVYPTTCGVFGRGSFHAPPDSDRGDELELVTARTCGQTVSVEWGNITARADRVIVDVEVVNSKREAVADEGSWDCSKETARDSHRVSLEYKFDGTRFRRPTPLPREITDALNKN